jgi:hypothetical protein
VHEIPSLINSKPELPSLSKRYEGCPIGGSVDLWAIPNAGHVPNFNIRARSQIAGWLLTHPKVDPNIVKYRNGKSFD